MQNGKLNPNYKGATIKENDGETAVIILKGGLETLVDSEDLPKLEDRSWIKLNNHSSRGYIGTYYAYTKIKNKTILMHRLIMNPPRGLQIDHINGNGLDNRKINLRIVTQSQNMHNVHKIPKNKFGLAGVRKSKTSSRFSAQIRVGTGNPRHLGTFATPEEAHEAYKKAKKKLNHANKLDN